MSLRTVFAIAAKQTQMQDSSVEHLSFVGLGTFRSLCVRRTALASTFIHLQQHGFLTFHIHFQEAVSKQKLIEACLASVGLSLECKNWDAFSDLLWQAMMERNAPRIAFVFHDAEAMIRSNLQLFVDSFEIFCGLGEAIETQVTTPDTRPILFRVVYVAGD